MAKAQRHEALLRALAHAGDERRDDAGSGAPGDVEARHRVAVLGGRVAAALGPADDREPAHAPGVQPGALLAGGEGDVGLGPLARPQVLRRGRSRPSPASPAGQDRASRGCACAAARASRRRTARRTTRTPARPATARGSWSSRITLRPASISSAVATSPASPPPTTMASASISLLPALPSVSAHARHLRRPQAGRAGAGALRALDEARNALGEGRRHAGLVGQREDRALQMVDLGRAAAAAGPPTSKSALAGRSPACVAPPAGTARRAAAGCRGSRAAARLRCAPAATPAAFSTASASSICAASSSRQRRSASSLASGRSDSALSALLRLRSSLPHSTPAMSACSATAAPGTSSASRKPGTPAAISMRAAGGAVEARTAAVLPRDLHHVEGHHARDDGRADRTKLRAQSIDVADTVLQADDDRIGRRVPGDQPGHLRRGAALDGDEHDLGAANAALGSVANVSAGGGNARSAPSRSEMRRPCRRDGVRQRRTQQQGHVAPRQRQAAAHIAADAAGAGNDDARGSIDRHQSRPCHNARAPLRARHCTAMRCTLQYYACWQLCQ